MPLIPAKCTKCGSNLEVDPTQEAAVCPYCNTAYITEKAINHYNTNNITNIGTLHADVVQLSDQNSVENRVKSGETFIQLNDFVKAKKVFEKLVEDIPYDYRSWLGLIKVASSNFTNNTINRQQLNHIQELYTKSLQVASEENKKLVQTTCSGYISAQNQRLTQSAWQIQGQIDTLNKQFATIVNEQQSIIRRLQMERNQSGFPTFLIHLIFGAFAVLFSGLIASNFRDDESITFFILFLIIFGIIGYFVGTRIVDLIHTIHQRKINRLDNEILQRNSMIEELRFDHQHQLSALQQQYAATADIPTAVR